jgi:hypothetical protein
VRSLHEYEEADRYFRWGLNDCAAAIADVRPSARVGFVKQVGCIEVSAYWKHWPCLFPQHGPGRKHERKIALSGWQRRIADRHPERLLRGLIHSDGCRVSNRILDKYEYPRYQFTNHSPDIRAVFCAACDRARIPWRQSNAVTISVSRRQAVATMDEFIGPKS